MPALNIHHKINVKSYCGSSSEAYTLSKLPYEHKQLITMFYKKMMEKPDSQYFKR